MKYMKLQFWLVFVVGKLGLDRDEVTGGWEELRNEELRNLCSSPTHYLDGQIKEDDMGGTRSTNRND